MSAPLPRHRTPPDDFAAAPTPTTGIRLGDLPRPEEAPEHARSAFLPADERRGAALCLSGGGFRAALFHLGAVRRLNELGALGHVNTVTSVSGGSILNAHLATTIGDAWPQPGNVLDDFDERVARPLHRFCSRNIRTWPLLIAMLPWNWFGHAAVDQLERQYFRYLTQLPLSALPERPRYVFCSTDMAYGVNWTFTRDNVGSYMAGRTGAPAHWTVARAVAASSCFPPVFNPQPIGLDPGVLSGGLDDSAERNERIRGLRLTDGGVYDNLGLEPVWKNHAVVLSSDGGSTFDAGGDRGLFWRLNRYVEIEGRDAGALRKRWLVGSFVKNEMRGTYWGIGTHIENYDAGVTGYPDGLVDDLISEIRTDMDAFTDGERGILENHGYLLADAALRRHAPFLGPDPDPASWPAASPPHPELMREAAVREALATSASRRLPFGRF